VDFGERAVRLTSRQDSMSLNTLAAAYAEVGRFDAAVATASEALGIAQRLGQEVFLPELAARLALYQHHEKCREAR
jgi:hypothetical protein